MKIGFCGTVSVGKTTLVNELKKLNQFKGKLAKLLAKRQNAEKNKNISILQSNPNGDTLFMDNIVVMMKIKKK